MKILRSKLYELEMRQRAEKANEAHKAKKEIAWGSQIRSYVLAPYRMVKDHRTGHETGNVDAVLDGEIMEFIRKYLLGGRFGRGNGGCGVSGLWNDLMKERFLKIGALRSEGRNPCRTTRPRGGPTRGPAPPRREKRRRSWAARPIRVDVAGRVMGLRRFGKAAFLVLFRPVGPAAGVPEEGSPRGGGVRPLPEIRRRGRHRLGRRAPVSHPHGGVDRRGGEVPPADEGDPPPSGEVARALRHRDAVPAAVRGPDRQ